MGEAAGDALATAITLIDGLVVIGGGLTGAAELFLPALVAEMNAPFDSPWGRDPAARGEGLQPRGPGRAARRS